MNNFMKIVLLLLSCVFVPVLILAVFGIFNIGSFTFFNVNSVKYEVLPVNYDTFLDKSVNLEGIFMLKPITCRSDKDCDYDVFFLDGSSFFSNFSVYENGRPITCYDEYSINPKKYISLSCGVKYLDRGINREKYKTVSLDFLNSKNYTFYVMRNLDYYYLDIEN